MGTCISSQPNFENLDIFSSYKTATNKMTVYSIPVTQKKEGETPIFRNPLSPDKLQDSLPGIQTLKDLFLASCQKYAERDFLGTQIAGKYIYQTYGQVLEQCKRLGSGIISEGLQTVDSEEGLQLVGVFSKNRAEWLTLEITCTLFNLQTVPLYDTLGEAGIKFILNQTECRTVFCSKECLWQLMKYGAVCGIKNVVCLDECDDGELVDWVKQNGIRLLLYKELVAAGEQDPRGFSEVSPESAYCLSYTSGTTGDPKGAILTHRNFVAVVAHVTKADVGSYFQGGAISYLPLPHVYEKMLNWNYINSGMFISYYRGDIKLLSEDIQLAQPTFFPGVPRVFSRTYDKLKGKIDCKGGIAGFFARSALNSKLSSLKSSNSQAAKHYSHRLYDAVVFNKCREALGGRVQAIVTASAPMDPEVQNFLKVCFSAPIFQGYGSTENSASGILSYADDSTSGHCGGPSMNTEVKLRDVPELDYLSTNPIPSGEILLRGPSVFKKYYKNQEQTDEIKDAEGWLHTGDVGQLVYDGKVVGAIRIIDRIKNIFKLQQGEYVACEKVEAVYVRAESVAECAVYGDSNRVFIVAVVVPDREAITNAAKNLFNITGEDLDFQQLCKREEIKKYIQEQMDLEGKKAQLCSFEQAKRIFIEPVSFAEQDLFTPSFKLKRFLFKKKYAQTIEQLYL